MLYCQLLLLNDVWFVSNKLLTFISCLQIFSSVLSAVFNDMNWTVFDCAGVRPYQCNECCKAFTQRCSLESHCRKVHGREFNFAHKQRRDKVYVCEECGHTTGRPELHYTHLKTQHPSSPALLRAHDKRYFKFAVAAARPPTTLPQWPTSTPARLLPGDVPSTPSSSLTSWSTPCMSECRCAQQKSCICMGSCWDGSTPFQEWKDSLPDAPNGLKPVNFLVIPFANYFAVCDLSSETQPEIWFESIKCWFASNITKSYSRSLTVV